MIQVRKSLGVLLLLGTLSCALSSRSEEHGSVQEQLTDTLSLLSKTVDFNGFGVAIVGPEGVLYKNGFGMADVAKGIPYTEHTMQPIASISKTFIGLAVMKAQELGKLKSAFEIATPTKKFTFFTKKPVSIFFSSSSP